MATKDRLFRELVTPGRLDKPAVVLRKVNVAKLSKRETPMAATIYEKIGEGQIEPGVTEKETVWYADGYLLNDQPRSALLTEELMGATTGFAVARSDTGEILMEGGKDSLIQMEKAVSGARLQLDVDVSVGAADDEDEDDESEDVD